VTLTDAGPLVALIDAGEEDHARCVASLEELPLPLVTTWAAFTEAVYLLGRAAGWRGQEPLWRLVMRGDLELAQPTPESTARAARLMERYSDKPMDLADATLVALAEERKLKKIFTLDADFHVYRLHGRGRFEVIPA
jgi:predicted nucleic acid-binding protein